MYFIRKFYAVLESIYVQYLEMLLIILIKTGWLVCCLFGYSLLDFYFGILLFLYCRYHYCERCFNELPGESVQLGEDPMSAG